MKVWTWVDQGPVESNLSVVFRVLGRCLPLLRVNIVIVAMMRPHAAITAQHQLRDIPAFPAPFAAP